MLLAANHIYTILYEKNDIPKLLHQFIEVYKNEPEHSNYFI